MSQSRGAVSGASCGAAGHGKGGVGPRTTYLSSQKVYFGKEVCDGGFNPYRPYHTEFPSASSQSRDERVGATADASFCGGADDGRGGLGPRTNHLSYQKVDCWIDGVYGGFCQYRPRHAEYPIASS